MRVLVGTSGYSYKEWKGSFYPQDIKAADMLRYYAERFKTVEINNTFYRMPGTDMLERWTAVVPEDFTFILKASRRITHEKKLGGDVADAVAFLFKTAQALGPKLGPVLFQLQPGGRAFFFFKHEVSGPDVAARWLLKLRQRPLPHRRRQAYTLRSWRLPTVGDAHSNHHEGVSNEDPQTLDRIPRRPAVRV